MNRAFLLLFLTIAFLTTSNLANAQQANNSKLDQIVAIVNDHIILKSDVDQQVQQTIMQMRQQRNQQIEFREDIWYSVMQNIVERYVLLDHAKRDSITVSNERVDMEIDRRINAYIQQVGSEAALEKELGQSIVQLRADLRDDYREQMVVQQYRQQKMTEVEITRPEVKEFFEEIPADSLPVIPERVAVSQIVAIPPPLDNARDHAYELAQSLRDSIINHGKSIEELARRHSTGPSANDGGKLPMMSINDLVAEYSAAASALEPGEISQVVETSFGFHVIRLNRRVGDEIDTNHILITMDDENYDDQVAINKLEQIRDSVLTNDDITISDMARKHSEDPITAPEGGRILNPQTGERLIALDDLDPALYRIVLLLEGEGDISEPKSFTSQSRSGDDSRRAFRIVRLDQKVPEHVASLDQDYQRIKSVALQRKQQEEMDKWIRKKRDEVYIEYKIPIPEQFKYSSL